MPSVLNGQIIPDDSASFDQEPNFGQASSDTNEQDLFGKAWHRLIVALFEAIRFEWTNHLHRLNVASFDHNLSYDLVILRTNGQITVTNSASFDQIALVAPSHQGYTQTWHHRVRMDKSLPLKLTNLGFEGPEPCRRFIG
ncbi:hypothetical protein GQ457_05G013040 [Hibiscus cannabinus]